jgi:galactokinase
MPDQHVLTNAFRQAFASEPSAYYRGPGRVNLIGEHTDYNGGFVLPFAIDRAAFAAVRPRTDRRIRLVTDFAPGLVEADLDSLEGSSGQGWAAYPLGVVWALGQLGADLGQACGFDLALASDVPVGAGLSSSAAIESAVGIALNDLWGLGLTRPALAEVGQLAENVVVGAPTGIMDQSASLLGERDAAVFLDCRSLVSEVVPLGLEEAGLVILVIDTRTSHAHANGGYGARRASCEAGAAALGVPSLRDVGVADLDRARLTLDDVTYRRVRHVVTENKRVLDTVAALRAEGPVGIGDLLDASHASMRDDFEISTPELDLAVETARAAGAVGARMTGGGFGGAAIAVVHRDRLTAVSDAVGAAFASAHFTAPALFTVRAVEGAAAIGTEGLRA